MKYLLIFSLIFLVSCTDYGLKFWPTELDSYMKAYGYTLDEERVLISKNSIPIYRYDRNCTRFCNSKIFVPFEILKEINIDLETKLIVAEMLYKNDLRKNLGLK